MPRLYHQLSNQNEFFKRSTPINISIGFEILKSGSANLMFLGILKAEESIDEMDLKLNVNESKKQVLVGLWSKQACDAMFARNHYTTDQLFHDLLDYEQMEKERTSRVMYKNHPKAMTQENKEKGYENKRDNTVPTDKNKETINQRKSSKPYLPARNEENKPLCFAYTISNWTTFYGAKTYSTGSKRRFHDDQPDVDSLQNFKVPALPEAKINLWAKETCVIPANYVGFVTVYSDLEKSKNVYIENQMVYRKCVPRCIVELDENGETNIPVINVTGRAIEVKEDEKMFRGVQCEVDRLTGKCDFTTLDMFSVNGPAIFQRLINSVLGSLRFTVAMAYMDDVLIPSSSVEEGLANLEQILVEAAFEKLKQELAGDNVLILYSHEAYTELHTDASQLGLGAALLQRGPDGLMRPVVYISRQTTPDESKYHANELETLCVIWAMEKLRVYLIGRPFTIVTDCSALRSTFSKKHMVSRVARWWLRSLEFSFEIRHRPGTQMCHVDALSRNPAGEPEETECATGLLVLANSFEESDWLCILQKQDSKIRDIVEILNKETKNTEEEKRVDREYEIRDGRLFKKDMDNVLWVVPKRARWQITKKWHDDIGHRTQTSPMADH
ncbi:RNase H-like domain found in reverse transcriptase [Popillia japonica]|uniref:RNase H-like domain found in reverse transcriptase n=1 Tax=Popillia japonica TaxID=7064 RepID=A0AAW1LTK4_POPJA